MCALTLRRTLFSRHGLMLNCREGSRAEIQSGAHIPNLMQVALSELFDSGAMANVLNLFPAFAAGSPHNTIFISDPISSNSGCLTDGLV